MAHSVTRPFQAAKETGRELVRELNAWHATSIVVGTIIGSGIFRVSSEMMRDVGSPGMVYVVWIVGGLLSFFGALTYAELGSLKPSAGGEYVYVRDGYGPLPGFLYAWTWFVIAKPASIAAIATGIVDVLSTFARFSFLQHVFLTLHVTSARSIEISYGALVAIAAAILISAVNYIGVRNAGNFQLVLTAFKVVMIAAVVLIGFTAASGTWSNFGTKFLGAKGGIAGFMAAMIAALWAYDGWNDLNMVSGEIRNPERNIPIALISGVALVAVLYMGMNAAIQYVMPSPAIAGSPVAGSAATQIAVGWWGAALVSAGMALSMLVTMNGTIMSGGRIPYAVARDGYFFKALAEVHPRFHTPSTAIVVQAIMSIALLLVGGAFKELFSLAIFAEWLFYMIAASTIFVFRKREPAAPRAYRTWGYPVVPALFIIAAAGLLYYTLTDPDTSRNSVLGMLVILAGVPVYWFFAKRRKET